MSRASEDLDHVDSAADLGERSHEGTSKQALSDVTRIDRDHVIAPLHQIFEGKIARPYLDRRGADHRDGLHAVEDAADVIVGIAVVVHFRMFPASLRAKRSNPVFFAWLWIASSLRSSQ